MKETRQNAEKQVKQSCLDCTRFLRCLKAQGGGLFEGNRHLKSAFSDKKGKKSFFERGILWIIVRFVFFGRKLMVNYFFLRAKSGLTNVTFLKVFPFKMVGF